MCSMLMEPRLLQNYNKDKEKANGDVVKSRNEDSFFLMISFTVYGLYRINHSDKKKDLNISVICTLRCILFICVS